MMRRICALRPPSTVPTIEPLKTIGRSFMLRSSSPLSGFSLGAEIWEVDGREDLDLFMGGGAGLKNPRLRKEAADGERGNAVDAEAAVGESHR